MCTNAPTPLDAHPLSRPASSLLSTNRASLSFPLSLQHSLPKTPPQYLPFGGPPFPISGQRPQEAETGWGIHLLPGQREPQLVEAEDLKPLALPLPRGSPTQTAWLPWAAKPLATSLLPTLIWGFKDGAGVAPTPS